MMLFWQSLWDNAFVIARAIHIVAIVIWIGGVAMITTVVLPFVRQTAEPTRRIETFERLEARFARQAKIMTLLAGASGFYMLYVLDGWGRYSDMHYWWIHAMTVIWLVFTLILFVFEPWFLHQWFLKKARHNPERTFMIVLRMHQILLGASLITGLGAVAGSHGWYLQF